MKKVIILLCLFFATLTGYSQQWSFLGLPNKNIGVIEVHPVNPNIILAADKGMTGHVYKSSNAGLTWDTVTYDPYNSFWFDLENPDTVFASFGIGCFDDGIYYSTDEGSTWQNLNWFYGPTCIIKVPYLGILIAGTKGGGVYRSVNNGANWVQINDSLDNNNVLSLTLAYLPIVPPAPMVLYVAGTKGGIYYYSDYLLVNPPSDYWHSTNTAVNSIIPAVTSNGGNEVWAAMGGGSWSDGMYHSIDFGVTWSVSEYWPYITDILMNPANGNTIYAADSGSGVKMTNNNGLSWKKINSNLGDSVVFCLAQGTSDTTRLYAGTSHGIYVWDVSAGVGCSDKDLNDQVALSPNPAKDVISIMIPQQEPYINVNISDVNGKVIKNYHFSGDKTEISIDDLAKGLYLVEINLGKSRVFKKFVKD